MDKQYKDIDKKFKSEIISQIKIISELNFDSGKEKDVELSKYKDVLYDNNFITTVCLTSFNYNKYINKSIFMNFYKGLRGCSLGKEQMYNFSPLRKLKINIVKILSNFDYDLDNDKLTYKPVSILNMTEIKYYDYYSSENLLSYSTLNRLSNNQNLYINSIKEIYNSYSNHLLFDIVKEDLQYRCVFYKNLLKYNSSTSEVVKSHNDSFVHKNKMIKGLIDIFISCLLRYNEDPFVRDNLRLHKSQIQLLYFIAQRHSVLFLLKASKGKDIKYAKIKGSDSLKRDKRDIFVVEEEKKPNRKFNFNLTDKFIDEVSDKSKLNKYIIENCKEVPERIVLLYEFSQIFLEKDKIKMLCENFKDLYIPYVSYEEYYKGAIYAKYK